MAAVQHYESVPYGPVAYARSIRRLGWLAALLVPAALMAVTLAARQVVTCPAGQVCTSNFATYWMLPGMALPTAILWGVPLHSESSRYIGVIATSAMLWILLGVWASRRATRRPIASWRTFFREYLVLLFGVWLGVFVGLLLLAGLVGSSTFSNLL